MKINQIKHSYFLRHLHIYKMETKKLLADKIRQLQTSLHKDVYVFVFLLDTIIV